MARCLGAANSQASTGPALSGDCCIRGAHAAAAAASKSRSRAHLRWASASWVMVDFRFSLIAALACLAVSILAGVEGVVPVAGVWALLAMGFLLRAMQGRRRG